MAVNFQRVGSVSNAHAGREFEEKIKAYFAVRDMNLSPSFEVPVGVGDLKKSRKFDLGSDEPAILVECKSHTWTAGGNSPSAKLTVWTEAMYFFHIAPSHFRKILCVLRDTRNGVSLAEHYLKNYRHLVPSSVEIWEFDAAAQSAQVVS
jgi:hypothetical protein